VLSESNHSGQRIGGKLGAHRKWAQCSDRTHATAAARSSFMSRFEREVDPEGKLSEKERAKRAESARRAYFVGLALKRHHGRQKAG
jgi:hypothetical protein